MARRHRRARARPSGEAAGELGPGVVGLGGRGALVTDPLTGTTAELRRVHPIDARKPYVCPGCNQEIAVRVGHVVVVPLADPSARRHWHRPCWERLGRNSH